MKGLKFYFTLMAMVLVSMAANAAVTVKLYGAPDSYYVKQMYPTNTLTPDADGFLEFKGMAMTYGTIYAAEGYKLVSVVDRATGEEKNLQLDDNGVLRCYLAYPSGSQTVEFDVTAVKTEEVKTITFTISGEGKDVSKISMISLRTHTGVSVSTTPKEVTVEEGDKFQIRPSVEGVYFYQVQVNEVPLVGDGYSTWYYTPQDGDDVVIFTEFPDQEVPVVVMLVGEDMDTDVVKSYTIDGAEIPVSSWYLTDEQFEEQEYFTVRYGKFLLITLNTDDYTDFDIQVNGETYPFQKADPIIDIMISDERGYGIYIDAKKTSVGVDTIGASANADTRIFNLQGIEVTGNNLPKGIYIKGGKLVRL